MKQCKSCKEHKDETEFYIEKKNKDGLNTQCKLCWRKYMANYYKSRPKLQATRKRTTRKYQQEIYNRVNAIRALGCSICPEKEIACIDFHHIDPKEKEYHIHKLIKRKSWIKIETELKKCIRLCANCHRKLHRGLLKLPESTNNDTIRDGTVQERNASSCYYN